MSDLSELQKQLKELDDFEFEPFDADKQIAYNKLFDEIFTGCKTSGHINVYNKGQHFHRIRVWEDGIGYHTVGEIWYPPKKFYVPGRLNAPHQRLLYTSIEPHIALIEKSPATSEKGTLLSIGIDTKELICMELGIDAMTDDQRMLPTQRDLNLFKYICGKCRQRVPSDKPYLYLPTIRFRSGYAKAKFNAYIYHSVAANLKGHNVAFRPDYIDDHHKFRCARNIEIMTKRSADDFDFKCISLATTLDAEGKFIFKRINNCTGHRTIGFRGFDCS